MKHKFFIIPAKDPAHAEDELNAFYAQHRVTGVEKQFIAEGANSFWSVCLTWMDNEGTLGSAGASNRNSKGKIDYKEVLGEEDFTTYAQLRDIRKGLAERDGVPPYAIFTNEQLAKMVQQRVTSKTGLLELDGVGQARVDKYGETFLAHLGSVRPVDNPHETGAH